MWIVSALLACGEPGHEGGSAGPGDPFRRIQPEQARPTLDASWARCEGGKWRISADVAGRAASARAIVVRTDGEPLAVDVALSREDLGEGAVWERYVGEVPASLGACDADHAATVLELRNADGVSDCLAFGAGAADVVAGRAQGRLAGIVGDFAGCRVR